MRHSREQKLMIDFDNKRVWCFVCQNWIPSRDLFIDGTHVILAATSTHTIWKEEKPQPKVEWPPVGSVQPKESFIDIPPIIPDIQLHKAYESDIERDIERWGE